MQNLHREIFATSAHIKPSLLTLFRAGDAEGLMTYAAEKQATTADTCGETARYIKAHINRTDPDLGSKLQRLARETTTRDQKSLAEAAPIATFLAASMGHEGAIQAVNALDGQKCFALCDKERSAFMIEVLSQIAPVALTDLAQYCERLVLKGGEHAVKAQRVSDEIKEERTLLSEYQPGSPVPRATLRGASAG